MHVARDDSDARRAEETSDDSSALSSAGFSVWERGTPARHVCRDHRAAKGTPANMLSCFDSSDTLEAVAALCKAMGANPWFSSAHGRTHTAELIRE